ncbi:MAG: histidine--tRNA ligase [Defluviitaleaceae bacterium]|nr:histidine--tRNA ligase [Defluviitaleaceae bacterium]
MKIKPLKGTNDYLPNEAQLRLYLQNKILETYKEAGFSQIITPILEDIENLDKSEGGENLSLIFKVLKRGEKLEEALSNGENLADMGLRYDLTLPLSRYYANNRHKLLSPFKVIQIDKVYRAERPQKGRLREFIQCDIDILGDDSIFSEIEIIVTTARALLNIDINNFTIKINDKRFLNAMLEYVGINEDLFGSVFITLDKLDKIGLEAVKEELEKIGISSEIIDKLAKILENPITLDIAKEIALSSDIITNLENIISSVKALSEGKFNVQFSPLLVRGQGYYTGTVFEIESNEFKGSIGGGGRYDEMIGKFLGEKVPACGFSIGFERIFSILTEKGYSMPDSKKQIVVLYDVENYINAFKKADEFRAEFNVLMAEKPKKMAKFLNKLTENGYYGFFNYGVSEEIEILK